MTNRVLWSAIAVVGLIMSSGCCCGPCGGCGGGLGMNLGGRFNDCDSGCPGSAGQTFCGNGCGERYWSDWSRRCDSCDCDGNFTGECCYGPFSWMDDAWMSFWGWQCCNSCNSGCDAGCHGGGCMGDNCPSCNSGARYQGYRGGYGGGGGCSSCGQGHMHDAPMMESAPVRESEPTPAPPKPSATSYRPQRNSVVTMSPTTKVRAASNTQMTKAPAANSVRQVQYQSSPTVRAAAASKTSTPNTSTPKTSTSTRAKAETTNLSRPPQSAADFDLPPGAQIIKIEDN